MIFLNNSSMKQLDWLGTSREGLLNEVAWVKLKERRTYHKLNMIYKILNNLAPSYLQELCPVQVRSITAYNLRTGEDYHVPHAIGLNVLKNLFSFLNQTLEHFAT